jgi:hypothetical protein
MENINIAIGITYFTVCNKADSLHGSEFFLRVYWLLRYSKTSSSFMQLAC